MTPTMGAAKRGAHARAVVVAAGLAGVVGVVSCRSPTQVKVVVTTDFDCADLKDVTVTVGTLGDALENAPPTSTSGDCSANSVGTIVVIPSGSDHADIGIKVVGGFGVKQAESCAPAAGSSPPEYGPGCIVARRALEFTPHTSLTVPIVLRASCNGIACGVTQTCVEGECVSATIPGTATCTGDGCAETVLEGDGGTADGGTGDAGSADPACGDVRGLQPGAAWPMAGYCPSGQSRSPYLGPLTTPTLAWSTGTAFAGRAAIAADGTIYATTSAAVNDLVAVDPSGNVKWSLPAAGFADPAIGADGTVYAETTTAVVALAPDGTQRWAAPIDASNGGALVLGGDGTIYAGGSTVVVAVDPAGHPKWSLGAPGGDNVPVVLGTDGTLYAGTGTGEVLAIAATTGTQSWSYTTPGTIGGLAVGTDGNVYAMSWGGTLSAVTPAGVLAWSFTAPQPGTTNTDYLTPPALAGDGTVYFSYGGNLRGFDRLGNLLWSFAAAEAGSSGSVSFAPAVGADGTIYFAASNGGGAESTYAVDAAGHEVWSWGSTTTQVGNVTIGFDGKLVLEGDALFAIGP
jgi:outer membrane protein assembly factor BamB